MGGSIIIYGYMYVYWYSEMGEGFEFWDVKVDQLIMLENVDDILVKFEKEQDFLNEKVYWVYVKFFCEKEKIYMRMKLEQVIDDLIEFGFYLLLFEVLYYMMFEEGYKIVFFYFFSIFG